MEILLKEGLTYLGYDPLLGYTINYETLVGVKKGYEALLRAIKLFARGPRHNPYTSGTFWSAPEYGCTAAVCLVTTHPAPRIFSRNKKRPRCSTQP